MTNVSGWILITGAGGYIGSIASFRFLEEGYNVVALDNFSEGFVKPLKLLQNKYGISRLKILKVDLNEDLSEVFNKNEIVAVLHCAAVCKPDESKTNPLKYHRNNVSGTVNLLQYMKMFGVNKLVFSSSASVYGPKKYKVSENSKCFPTHTYGVTKLVAENIISSLNCDINYVILRYFNVCGATSDGSYGDSKKPSVSLIQNVVRSGLGIQQFSATYSKTSISSDSSPVRDYIDVLDLVDAQIKSVKLLCSGFAVNEIFNIGTGKGTTVLEAINQVSEKLGVRLKSANSVDKREDEDPYSVANCNRAIQVLGWRAKRSISDSIDAMIKWYTSHPNGWES